MKTNLKLFAGTFVAFSALLTMGAIMDADGPVTFGRFLCILFCMGVLEVLIRKANRFHDDNNYEDERL